MMPTRCYIVQKPFGIFWYKPNAVGTLMFFALKHVKRFFWGCLAVASDANV